MPVKQPIRVGSSLSNLQDTKDHLHMLRTGIDMSDEAKTVVREWASVNGISDVNFYLPGGSVKLNKVSEDDKLDRVIFFRRDLEAAFTHT